MQRLRRIKQLANAHLVYPGANHTRFDHSLGVMHVADRLAQQLRWGDEQRQLVRLAALTHDVGHPAFSHVGETIIEHFSVAHRGGVHEKITCDLLLHHDELNSALGEWKERVVSLIRKETISAETAVISGPLDADKLDYLLRDSYYAGVAYGMFDLERIIRTVVPQQDRNESYIAIREKGRDSLESYRLARYLMHAQVYGHHARLAADAMLHRAMLLAYQRGCLDPQHFAYQPDSIEFLQNYLRLDDARLLTRLVEANDEVVSQLADSIENRRLFKRAWVKDIENIGDVRLTRRIRTLTQSREGLEQVESEIAERAGIKAELTIAFPQRITNPLYRLPGVPYDDPSESLLVLKEDGNLLSLDDISPLSIKTKTPVERLIIFCPADAKAQVAQASNDWFQSLRDGGQ
jgi:hypothetical protein